MCIIVAKNAGVKMPTKEILSNCFDHNPDGAGIMLAAKGKVYGFKGLMTYDAFTAKLKQLKKRFGSLDDLPVVMHFRIGTHGSNIAANTHPFPVASNYKALRKLEWTSDLGMAHNGIISSVGHHPDVKKENVSDTMVFIRRVVAPFALKVDPMENRAFLNAFQLMADSKLCFLDGKGRLEVLGDFVHDGGVYYSNSTYKEQRYKASRYYFDWDWDEIYPVSKKKKKDNKEYFAQLSPDDEAYLMEELAFDYGLTELIGVKIVFEDYEVELTEPGYAIDEASGIIYYWNSSKYEWELSAWNDKYTDIISLDGDDDA